MAREIDTDSMEDRLRRALNDDPNIGEVRMFGGVCFMLNGNMLVCSTRSDNLLARIGPAGLDEPGARPMVMGGRPMKDFFEVDAAVLDDEGLRLWIARATDYVGPMSPKATKPREGKKLRPGTT